MLIIMAIFLCDCEVILKVCCLIFSFSRGLFFLGFLPAVCSTVSTAWTPGSVIEHTGEIASTVPSKDFRMRPTAACNGSSGHELPTLCALPREWLMSCRKKFATDSKYLTIAYLFWYSRTTVCKCVKNFCAAAESLLVPRQIKIPVEVKVTEMAASIECRRGGT